MSTITEVQFTHENGALAHTLNELPEVDIKVLRETSTEPAQNTYFIRFDHTEPADVRAVLESDHTVRDVSPHSESETRQVWRVEFAAETKLLNPHVTNEGGCVLHARSSTVTDERCGWHERWLLPDHEALQTIWREARAEGFEFEILHFHPWDGTLSEYTATNVLTEQQREALALAYENGYFRDPSETDLEELAAELEVSPSAVAGRLKRGTKLLVEEALIVSKQTG